MQQFDLLEFASKVALYFLPFLFALSFHEFAHGFVAKLKGDRTAELMGRLNLNPLTHMDPIGTFMLPMAAIAFGTPFFGWAKPVPVNPRNLRSPREDMFWIAFAGPLSNLLLAAVGWLAVVVFVLSQGYPEPGSGVFEVLKVFIIINLFLAFFNLIPLHPLDGGKVIARFIPSSWDEKLEQFSPYAPFVLIVLFISGGFWLFAGPVLNLGSLLIYSAVLTGAALGG